MFIIKYLLVIFAFIIFFTQTQADERTEKLKKLLDKGLITETEFKELLNTSNTKVSKIKVKQISGKTGREKFEKYEFYIDNFRVHTLNPGKIRIDNMITGETDLVLSGNFKVKFNNQAKNYFRFDYDKANLKADLFYKGRKIINWTGRYVSRYQATFHQMQVDGIQPFHYFIVIPGKNPISINYKVFEKKIEKAVLKVKNEMSLKYNLSLQDIDKIMETKETAMSKEQEKIIKDLVDKYAGKEITDEIRKEIEKTVGQEMANAFISEIEAVTGQAIDAAVERELASAIDEAVAYAVQQGISAAVAAAAIEAMIIVYALGGSDEDAMNACRSIAGDAC